MKREREKKESDQKSEKSKIEKNECEVKEKQERGEAKRAENFYAKPSDLRVAYFTKQPVLVFVYKEACLSSNSLDPSLPSSVSSLLQEFEDLFPEETPSGLPPIRGIEHQIDFIPGATIPNWPAYRCNPEQTKELQRQVQEPLAKGNMSESLSPCTVSVLLVPKKDGTWRMCCDCRAVNNITVKYRHSIPRLDDMLDEFMVPLFSQKLISNLDTTKLE